MTETPAAPTPEKTLFKTQLTTEEAKAAVIKELADKEAAAAAAAKIPPVKGSEAPTATVTDPAKPAVTTTQTDYTLDLPENSVLTKEELAEWNKSYKDKGLTKEQAQADLQSKDQVAKAAQTRLQAMQVQELRTMVDGWKDAVNKDPEIGGSNLAATAIKGSRALKATASPALQKLLVDSGFIHHPEVIRHMIQVHDLIGEDGWVKSSNGTPSQSAVTMDDKAKKLFGNPTKETV